ncbi:hypothetical protein HOLleu_37966 [Holothuria leucospilota]|uniref:Uncharacterized protein n=1 Tax=Holothuria leucospilota TaxID=206669 RepID=A0A9Q0YI10_HOLLE|nr:hypothetical protein HOLleu_37966 [Holothuria leucospilota]
MSFLAHAELETGVAARKFRRCNEKSHAAARACLGKQPALQTRTSAGVPLRKRGRQELCSPTSFLAHAELETGVAARKFRSCNEKSHAAAHACLGKQRALQTRTSAG